jgi:hypothetical protein
MFRYCWHSISTLPSGELPIAVCYIQGVDFIAVGALRHCFTPDEGLSVLMLAIIKTGLYHLIVVLEVNNLSRNSSEYVTSFHGWMMCVCLKRLLSKMIL